MTTQIPDFVRYQKKEYHIAGVSSIPLVDGRALGLTSHTGGTACRRGYYCIYAIQTAGLFLVELITGTSETLVIDGIAPVPHRSYSAVYRGLHRAMPYTGGLLGGWGLMGRMPVPMGFCPPHTFKTLLEFRFRDGRLILVSDRSQRMAEVRQKMDDEFKAWQTTYRAELDEYDGLRRQICALKQQEARLPQPWKRLLPNYQGGEPDIPCEELRAKREAIRDELLPIRARFQELEKLLYRQRKSGEDEWLAESFSLDYDLREFQFAGGHPR